LGVWRAGWRGLKSSTIVWGLVSGEIERKKRVGESKMGGGRIWGKFIKMVVG